MRRSAIQEELGVEQLLLPTERNQMMWLEHVVRTPPWEGVQSMFYSGRPPEDPRHDGGNMSLG